MTGASEARPSFTVQDVDLQTETIPLADELPLTPPVEAPGPGAMIVFDGVTKIYEPDVVALRDVSFVIDKGEFVFVVGPPAPASRPSSGC